ncbi:MAG: hypothetical protein ACREB6_03490, partial [Rhodospirillales bacterium]
ILVDALSRSRQFWILFGVAWWLCLAGTLPTVADGTGETLSANESRQNKAPEPVTKDNFRFQLFTIPNTAPRTLKDLMGRPEKVQALFNEWFLGKQIAEFIRFFEEVNNRQGKLDRDDLRAFNRFTIRLLKQSGQEIDQKWMQVLKGIERTRFDRKYHRVNKKYEFQHQHLISEVTVQMAEKEIDPFALHLLQRITVTWWAFIDVDENGTIRNIRVRVDETT